MSTSTSVLAFDGNDRIVLPKGFPSIQTAIAIEFWAKGNSSLGEQTSVIEAHNAQNQRVLNIHLPWKHVQNTRIFWDAGNQSGYDRIDKEVQLTDYQPWTHWAYIKDASTGQMSIYRNGDLWHEGTGKNKSLAGIEKFVIGSYVNATHYWKGLLSELRIWNVARTEAEIKANMKSRLTGKESGLVGYYPLNGNADDLTGNDNNGTISGATFQDSDLELQPAIVPAPMPTTSVTHLKVTSAATGNVLDVAGGQTNPGSTVIGYASNGGVTQKWTWESNEVIKSDLGDYALDIQDIPDLKGSVYYDYVKLVVINPIDGSATQKWELDNTHKVIKNKSNGFALATIPKNGYDVVLAYPIHEDNLKDTEKWQWEMSAVL